LYNYSVIVSKDGQRLTADSIYYDMNLELAKAYHNIDAQDSSQKVIGRGNYAEFWKKSPSRGFITGHSYVIDYSEKDSLFLAGDTIFGVEVDSTRDEIRAYHHVRFYRNDMQGKCDSMVYASDDSILSMYGSPILWSEESQLTGDQIDIHMKDQKADYIHITKNAMIVQYEGEDMYNQLSGKESKAYLKGNKLTRVDMLGDAISIYYSKDDHDGLIGVNKAKGNAMSIFMKSNKKVDKIVMTPDSEGVLYPPMRIPEDEKRLSKFQWLEEQRPKSKEDIFVK
jgi:lipopolysaccharide export system protein LptA